MSGSWLPRRGVRRGAMIGLAVGLAALAAITIGGTMTTRQATTDVRASNQISHRWSHVFVQISEEDEALHKYLATGTDLDRDRLLASVGSAEPDLDWLAARGGDYEAFQVSLLRHDYVRYENSLRAFHD